MSSSHPPDPGAWDAPCPKQGRSERKGEAYSMPYVEPLGEARRSWRIRWVGSLFSPHCLPLLPEKSRCMGSNWYFSRSNPSRPMFERSGDRSHLPNRRTR
jgi:hypothetical protein